MPWLRRDPGPAFSPFLALAVLAVASILPVAGGVDETEIAPVPAVSSDSSLSGSTAPSEAPAGGAASLAATPEAPANGEGEGSASAQPSAAPAGAELDPVSKRLFGVIPNYKADQKTDAYEPLTVAGKYQIARQDSFDWPNFPLLAGYALQAQVAAGGFSHNGGMKGFGEYYARGFGDQVIGSYLTEAILPGLLHEDPRFFRIGTGTFWHRISYAASRIFVTKCDDGKTRLYKSEVFGNVGVVAISSLYYPNSGALGEMAEHYAMQLGNDAISNILTEFWPDIKHRLRFVTRHLYTPRS